MCKKVYIISFIFFFIFSLFPQTPLRTADLSTQKPSWQAVIGGEAIAQIAETSYGFAVSSDGRMVSTCTYNGNVMWQKGVKGRPSQFLTAWKDFIYTITDNSVLNFINPSGVTVWSKDCGFAVTHSPVTGWDGRIFVQGNTNLSCYGLKGNRKWKIDIEQIDNLPLCEFPDGTLLVFFKKTENSKSVGLRISPFGEVLEKITFAGKIIDAKTCDDGILMTFNGGSFGLCTVSNNSAISRWVHHDNTSSSSINLIICGKTTSSLIYQIGKNAQVILIENKTGKTLNSFSIGKINLQEIQYSRFTSQGYFVCDCEHASEFNEDGTILWNATLPAKFKWNYIKYTDKNQILICMKNWVLNAFVMSQSVNEKTDKTTTKEKKYTNSSSFNQKIDGITYFTTPISRLKEINETFCSTDYGAKEKQMSSELLEMSASYIDELSNSTKITREKNSVFNNNPVYTQSLLEAICRIETDIFISDIAQMLTLENDPLLLNVLIYTAGEIGYDKEGNILKAFEKITVKNVKKDDIKCAELLCDSIYKIVAFMGRPALYRQGKQLLSRFMYPQYNKQIRDYARLTLTKIISLEI